MAGYVRDDLPDEEVQRQRDLYGPFTQSLRELVQQNVVELEVALASSDRPDELLLALRQTP